MYDVKELFDQQYKVYELSDRGTNSWVKVAPERGGIVYSYGVAGEELLYLNEETFYQTDKNVRGGIPILFPISGQLTDGTYEWEGKTYEMSNHGFARNAAWEVVGRDRKNGASLTLKLVSNEQTKKSYPFEFEVLFTYVLENGKFTIQQEYKNTGAWAMPMYPGFHPYFKTSGKDLAYETDATTYVDYNDGEKKEFTGRVDLTDLKESVVLIDPKQRHISFQPCATIKKIRLNYGESFKYVVLWTEKGKEFVCVEPWMAKTDELNRKEELLMIPAKDSLKTEFSIE
ncbi:aldose epimerase [Salipaludibacillus sp. HK11]|uniref:aldose epimerase family protein n=1 Tax=Salipaludibacillus sp. HK11 TaxID=3394320 RepID=UPI0039FBB037